MGAREAAIALLWVAAIFRLTRGRQRPHAGSLRSITIALFAIAIAGTVDLEPVNTALGELVNWPNIGGAVKNVGIVVAAVGNQLMLLHLDRGDGLTRRSVTIRWSIAAAVSGLSVALFVAGGRFPQDPNFLQVTAAEPWVAESRLVVTIFAAYVLGGVAWLCARQFTRSPLGRGLGVLGLGAALMVVYCVLRVLYIGGQRLGLDVGDAIYDAGSDLSTVGLALVAVGTLLPPLEQSLRARRELRHLDALWADATGQEPAAVERNPELREPVARVHHRVVQVQDALFLLAIHRGAAAPHDADSGPQELAARISRWVRDHDDRGIGPRALRPPDGLDQQAWVRMIADAHRSSTPIPTEATR